MDQVNTQITSLGAAHFLSPAGDNAGFFVDPSARIRLSIEINAGQDVAPEVLFEKAGPRRDIYFDPAKARAAIVTCGGLCPGLNNVIRSAVRELCLNYGVKDVLGIRYGYAGLNPKVGEPPIRLTPESVDHIHQEGGTILGSSRGPQPIGAIVDFLCEQKINILLCVGGDGTLKGADAIAQEVIKRKLSIAVIGIPKTIDNDVAYMTRTFGLATAADVSRGVLSGAHAEAKSAYNGVGLVKLMGRDSGFVAAAAALASQEVNACLIPEVPIVLDGPKGFLEYLRRRLQERHHALVVVAEGAGQELMRQLPAEVDASGNKRYGDIGVYLKERIISYLKGVQVPVEVKYFDPSYLVRSVPANVDDAILCDQFARNAVHAAMAGKTGAVVGFLNGAFVHIPIALAVSKKKKVDTEGILWTGVLAATGQPKQWS